MIIIVLSIHSNSNSYYTGNTVDLNWNLEQKPSGELVVLGSGSYGKVYHTIMQSYLLTLTYPYNTIKSIYYTLDTMDCCMILKFLFAQVYKGCCRNTGKHLAVKVVLDLTQKVRLCCYGEMGMEK